MSNKTVIGIVAVLIVILGLVWWGLSDKQEVINEPVDNGSEVTQDSLTVDHYYEDGKHTIEGTITLPTPCHTITGEAIVAESMPEQITIKLTTKAGEGICTQVLADKFFRVTFNASKEAVIKATLDGKPITLVFSQVQEGITK
ncbi:MAG TPA: hypothetical protein VJB98_02900 [Candidatus Paceibacterota bacterium]